MPSTPFHNIENIISYSPVNLGCCIFFFRPSPGETIRRILKNATIDVEKMKNEELLPADGKGKL